MARPANPAAPAADPPAGGPPRRASKPAPVQGSDAEVNRYLAAYIMGVANRLANGASNHYRTRFNMGMSEWRAMMAIGTSSHRIVREVAEMADLDYAAASKSLKLLQQRGLVAIEQTQRRGRAAIASLTPEGLVVYRQLRSAARWAPSGWWKRTTSSPRSARPRPSCATSPSAAVAWTRCSANSASTATRW